MKISRILTLPCVLLFGLNLSVGHAGDMWKQHISEQPRHARNSGFNLTVGTADATSIGLQWQPQEGASEYEVSRDNIIVGRTIATVGRFTDFGLRPGQTYRYRVTAYNASGALISQSMPMLARTTRSTSIRTHYNVLAIAFNPERASLRTEETYTKHRIQFLKLASLGSAEISLYKGGIQSLPTTAPAIPGTNSVDYVSLVSRRDLGLGGYSIIDLIERGDIDHVWVVKSQVDFGENAFMGNRRIQGDGVTTDNTWVPIPVKCSRSFFVNAYSPDERSYDAYAHMVEGVMTSISDGHPEFWPRDLPYTVYTTDRLSLATREALLNTWERFRLADEWNGTSPVAYASKGNGNMGSSHFPPNSSRDCDNYCYYDHATWQRYIDSVADDWFAFPNFSNTKRKLNGYDFGAFNNYAEGDASYSAAFGASPELHSSFVHSSASFHQWWFAHLPHNPGVDNSKLNNWWPYLYDFNRFDGSRIDYEIKGFPKVASHFNPVGGEVGTEVKDARNWGYWNSQNGTYPGGAKVAEISAVIKQRNSREVRTGERAIKVYIENSQYGDTGGFGRNDVFYPASRNAHWNISDLTQLKFSIKPGINKQFLVGTNPIVRLYKNGGTRIEFVPRNRGVYANLFLTNNFMDSNGWYNFSIPLAGDATWEKNIIGYIEPGSSDAATQAARAQLESEILSDLNYVEISIRSTNNPSSNPPYDVVSYYIDGLELLGRYGSMKPRTSDGPRHQDELQEEE